MNNVREIIKSSQSLTEALEVSKQLTKYYSKDSCAINKPGHIMVVKSTPLEWLSSNQRFPYGHACLCNRLLVTISDGHACYESEYPEYDILSTTTLLPVIDSFHIDSIMSRECRDQDNTEIFEAFFYTPAVVSLNESDDALEQAEYNNERLTFDVISRVSNNRFDANKSTTDQACEICYHSTEQMILIAATKKVDNLIICISADEGEPFAVVKEYTELMEKYRYCFREIVFAIDATNDDHLYNICRRSMSRFSERYSTRLERSKLLKATVEDFEDTIHHIFHMQDLKNAVRKTHMATQFYSEKAVISIPDNPNKCGNISVTPQRTLAAAFEIHKNHPEYRITCLNFAAANVPGGGPYIGSNGQEESLCRSTTLFPCIETTSCRRNYYDYHKSIFASPRGKDATDACIYTPDIVVFKTDEQHPQMLEEKEWFKVDIITCSAPELREGYTLTPEEQKHIHLSRIRHIIKICASNTVDALVLGAFGCGAYNNNPEIVASAFSEVLEEYRFWFSEISFAIANVTRSKNSNLVVFSRILCNDVYAT